MIAHTTETAGTQIKSIDGVVEAAAAVAANTPSGPCVYAKSNFRYTHL
jgi:hypothetical protein